MDAQTRRLLSFALGLAVLAAVLELYVRGHESAFRAATHRARTKVALLEEHGPVDFLILGTSRLWDGVSPNIMSDAINAMRPDVRLTGFNAAFTSSNLKALEDVAARCEAMPGLRLALFELSVPQLEDGPSPWADDPVSSDDGEAMLTRWVHDHAHVIANRKAFVSDNLQRLPSLLWFGSRLDGSEVLLSEQFASFVGRRPSGPADRRRTWAPIRWTGAEPDPGLAGNSERERLDRSRLAQRLGRLAGVFSARGIASVFVVPPLRRDFRFATEREPSWKSLARLVALETGIEVWDYSSAVLPDDLFRDESHLAREGRAEFSWELAREVAGAGFLARLSSAR